MAQKRMAMNCCCMLTRADARDGQQPRWDTNEGRKALLRSQVATSTNGHS